MTAVLVINSGSSSFTYQLLEVETGVARASGLVERIGQPMGTARHTVLLAEAIDAAGKPQASITAVDATSVDELPIPDHTAGFQAMLDAFAAHGPSLDGHAPVAVGHRVVHGGSRFFEPTVITAEVAQGIDELSVLAPLHNPGALQGIRAAKAAFPDLPHVAVFDTAFHQTLAAPAYTYAIDREIARQALAAASDGVGRD